MDKLICKLTEPHELIDIIDRHKKNTDCDEECDESQQKCQTTVLDDISSPCSIISLLVNVIAEKPTLLDDSVKAKVVDVYKGRAIKIDRLISLEYLTTIHKSGSQIMSWIKYESLIIHLIKEEIYEPETMANEVLAMVKDELDPAIACKLASVIEGCVKHCRETSKGKADEELDEKWCEIIDWLSWFLASKDDDFD